MTVVPGPAVETIPAERVQLDDRFKAVDGDERVERLWSGGRWLEGPVYVPAYRSLLFSDIPNDRILRYDEVSGAISIFRQPAGNTNGHTLDEQGRLVSCQHGHRQVVRTEHDGSITVLAGSYDGKRLNSPNDVVVRRDGSVWFTDPPYGRMSDYEGNKGDGEVDGNYVYRVDPATGDVRVVADDFTRPNGLAFSLDESKLYIVDTPEKHIRVFDVDGDKLTGGDVFAPCTAGMFDGIRLDTEGRVWAATHEGVHCFDPDGTLIGKLVLPEATSNICFGGPKRNRLFMTATSSVYSWLTTTNGAPQPYDPPR
ncbi:MAG TPA: SMP-30/gluconolactonase/LRE family protein [Kribbellaceae bacterium]|nr:SMP-30/gluconolactonase/LRE family protein [Kribbellaceae bacterium]